jgi:ketosteroid isomerase-like protein
MPSTARDTAERFLAATTGADPGDLADCYAPQVVIEMPFAPAALYPARTETDRESLRARFRAGAALRRYERLSGVRIHETADPEVVIVEYDLHGRLVAGGEPFTLSFLMVITVRDGLIVHTRDYADPIAGATALGRLPALLEALTTTAAG